MSTIRRIGVGVLVGVAISTAASASDLSVMMPSGVALLADTATRTAPPKPKAEYRSTVGTGDLAADLAKLPPFAIASTEKREEIVRRIKTDMARPELQDGWQDLLCLGWAVGAYYSNLAGAIFGVACVLEPYATAAAQGFVQGFVDDATYQFMVQQAIYLLCLQWGGLSNVPIFAMLNGLTY